MGGFVEAGHPQRPEAQGGQGHQKDAKGRQRRRNDDDGRKASRETKWKGPDRSHHDKEKRKVSSNRNNHPQDSR